MRTFLVLTLSVAACGGTPAVPREALELRGTPVDTTSMPPVATDPELALDYPETLASQAVKGTVVLRLWVTESGHVVADSTRVVESSGYPAMDTAAARGATRLRFAPALREGRPAAIAFLQPIHFRTPTDGSQTP